MDLHSSLVLQRDEVLVILMLVYLALATVLKQLNLLERFHAARDTCREPSSLLTTLWV